MLTSPHGSVELQAIVASVFGFCACGEPREAIVIGNIADLLLDTLEGIQRIAHVGFIRKREQPNCLSRLPVLNWSSPVVATSGRKTACGLRVRRSCEGAVQNEAGISEMDKAYLRVHLNT
jgi:hypothetical protein